MNKKLLIYGSVLAALTLVLKLAEYRFVMMDHKVEVYAGIIALIFTVIGVAAGKKFTQPREVVVEKEVLVHLPAPAAAIQPLATDVQLDKLGMSKREYEILVFMAEGLSNQEIADRTFVSIHTVKTHVSNVLLKLDAKRRTQAVTKARELNLIG
jgi:two-component system, NarL family, response regulator LiaR